MSAFTLLTIKSKDHKNMRVAFGVMILTLLLQAHVGFAQELSFEKGTHDFGEVNEEDGPISYTFRFVNTSDKTAQIKNVSASCGCTTPQWTSEVLQPGDSGLVIAEYNPLNRPGKFNKSLAISYLIGEESQSNTLFIEGIVKPKPTTIEDELPTLMGGLRVKYKSFNMGRITDKELVVKQFDVYNASDTVIVWKDSMLTPSHINISFSSDTLQPDDLGAVVLTYDPKEKKDLGFVSDNVVLYTSEKEDADKSFNVIATIQEYFPEMTEEELARAPRLSFDRTQHDFGQVSVGNTVVTEFTITNNGQQDLSIRKTKPNCGCTVSVPEKDQLAPGESMKMEVSFNTSGRRGRQYKTVTVFSNDPTAPSQMISIKADIQE